MSDFVSSYSQKIFQKYDLNRNGVINAAPLQLGGFQIPIGGQPEVSGRAATYFADQSAFRSGQMDPYTLQNAVARDFDVNKDGQVGFFEKVWAAVRFGVWAGG